jgi:hypothetical protein
VLAADDFGPALRRNGSDAELGKMDAIDQKRTMQLVCARVRARHGVLLVEPGTSKTNNATSMGARARASWGLTGRTRDMTLVSNQPSPNRRKGRLLCGAKTRAGGCCQVRAELGKARCRFHGGKSTGPKTEAGRNRIAEAQRQRWRAYRETVRKSNARESEGGLEGMELPPGNIVTLR